jgi:hypothetical protein
MYQWRYRILWLTLVYSGLGADKYLSPSSFSPAPFYLHQLESLIFLSVLRCKLPSADVALHDR